MRTKFITTILCALSITGSALGAVIPSGDLIEVGGRTFQLPNSKFKTLVGVVTTAGKNNATFRKTDATPYQVPGGKVFRISALECTTASASALEYVILGYSDNNVGINSASAFTNFVRIGGDDGSGVGTNYVVVATDQINPTVSKYDLGSGFVVPAGKYPGFTNNNTAFVNCTIHGTEE